MLGQLDVVQAFVKAQPGIERKLGPHAIPLLAHSKAGGEKASALHKFLEGIGDAGIPLPTQPLSNDERDSVVGRYAFGQGASDYFEINVEKERPGISRPGGTSRSLHHSGAMAFFPSGAPWAKIAFQNEAGKVVGFTLGSLKAKRI